MADVTRKPPSKRTAFAILGFLATTPRSGYDIRRAIAKSTGYFWTESYGQIYPSLRELQRDGLIESFAAGQATGRGRQTFRITDAGLATLREWIEQPFGEFVVRNELLLKLFFGRFVPVEVSILHLEEYRNRLIAKKALYESYRDDRRPSDGARPDIASLYRLAPLEHGICSAVVRIEWCNETIAALRAAQSG